MTAEGPSEPTPAVRASDDDREELGGFALFGGRQVEEFHAYSGPDAFVLHVRAVAVFGAINVRTGSARRRWD